MGAVPMIVPPSFSQVCFLASVACVDATPPVAMQLRYVVHHARQWQWQGQWQGSGSRYVVHHETWLQPLPQIH